MARISRKIWDFVYQIILMVSLTLLLFSCANFAQKKWDFAPETMGNLFGKLDIPNKIYYHISVVDLTGLFPADTTGNKHIELIIVHHDSTSYNYAPIIEINNYHASKGWKNIGYHYYISTNGTIYKLHNERECTIHAGQYNNCSIGVCLQGNFERDYPSANQIESLTRLLMRLKASFNVPLKNIKGHKQVRNTLCPGRNLNLNQVKDNIKTNHILEPVWNLCCKIYNEL